MPDQEPVALADIPAEGLKHDWALLDQYQAFSAELVRTSLAGIAAVGFLVTALAGEDSLLKITGVPSLSRWGMAVTLFSLGLAAGTALAHRFVSSDSMACHISLLRMQLRGRPSRDVEAEKAQRNRRFKQSGALLLVSSWLLGIGALSLAIAFVGLLWTFAG
jgi:hypothetical protein